MTENKNEIQCTHFAKIKF